MLIGPLFLAAGVLFVVACWWYGRTAPPTHTPPGPPPVDSQPRPMSVSVYPLALRNRPGDGWRAALEVHTVTHEARYGRTVHPFMTDALNEARTLADQARVEHGQVPVHVAPYEIDHG